MSLALLFFIPRKFHVFPLFSYELGGIQLSLPCPGVSHPVCCCLRVQPSPGCSGQGKMSSAPGGCDFHLSLGTATASHQLHSRDRNWRQIPAALDMDRQDISLNPCLYNTRSRDGFEGHLWLFFEASTSQFAGFAPASPFPPFIQSLISTTQICRILWLFTVLFERQLSHGSDISISFLFFQPEKRGRGADDTLGRG